MVNPTGSQQATRDGAGRFMRTVEALIAGYEQLSRLDRGRPPVRLVDRDVPVLVESIREEAVDVRGITLVSADGAQLPGWHPGAHLDVVLPSGRMRQYSLCGNPADQSRYRIAVRRLENGDGGSCEIHDTLRVGDRLTVRGPRNAFPFIPSERYLFIAGGIGITAILPMVRAAAAAGADWRLVYCGRSRESMPFRAEVVTLDPARVWLRPDEEYGVPASGAELFEHAPEGARVYCCGPVPMTTGVRLDLPASRADALHFERFSPPPIVAGKPFEVELARSGRVLEVPADRSALDVIRDEQPGIPYSCRQGFCGTCTQRVLAGAVEHNDHVLTPEERTVAMTICVSRASGGRVVLDV